MLRNGKDETYKHEFDIEVVLCKKLADVISAYREPFQQQAE